MLGRVKRGEPLESVFPRGILYDVYYTLSRIIYALRDNPDARNARYAVSTGDAGRKRGYGKRIQSHRRPAAAHSPIQGEPRQECAKGRRMLRVKHAGARTRFRRLRSHPPRARKKKGGGANDPLGQKGEYSLSLIQHNTRSVFSTRGYANTECPACKFAPEI